MSGAIKIGTHVLPDGRHRAYAHASTWAWHSDCFETLAEAEARCDKYEAQLRVESPGREIVRGSEGITGKKDVDSEIMTVKN